MDKGKYDCALIGYQWRWCPDDCSDCIIMTGRDNMTEQDKIIQDQEKTVKELKAEILELKLRILDLETDLKQIRENESKQIAESRDITDFVI